MLSSEICVRENVIVPLACTDGEGDDFFLPCWGKVAYGKGDPSGWQAARPACELDKPQSNSQYMVHLVVRTGKTTSHLWFFGAFRQK